jgi:hypothetical protein
MRRPVKKRFAGREETPRIDREALAESLGGPLWRGS